MISMVFWGLVGVGCLVLLVEDIGLLQYDRIRLEAIALLIVVVCSVVIFVTGAMMLHGSNVARVIFTVMMALCLIGDAMSFTQGIPYQGVPPAVGGFVNLLVTSIFLMALWSERGSRYFKYMRTRSQGH